MFISLAAAGVGRSKIEKIKIHPKNEMTKNLTHYHIFPIHYNLYNIVIFFYSVLESIVVIILSYQIILFKFFKYSVSIISHFRIFFDINHIIQVYLIKT